MSDVVSDIGSMPSVLRDPFSKQCITAIRVHYYTPNYMPGSKHSESCSGTVEMVNGATGAVQEFRGRTLGEVLAAIAAFVEGLP